MFEKARLKLTLWYLLIIMLISVFFSAFIYFGLTREFDRVLRFDRYRIEHPELIDRYIQRPFWDREILPYQQQLPDPRIIQSAKVRVFEALGVINILILVLSSIAGYFLAGRTLRPIKEMVDEQNRFITDASHELNTPLTSLKTSIEVNLRDNRFSIERAKKLLQSNLEDIESLQTLSDELIKLSKYQQKNNNLNIEKILLNDILDYALAKVESVAKKKNIKISVALPKTYVFGDKSSLSELFIILLDNAVKYSDVKKEIKVIAKKTDSKISISVEDHGIGISEKDLPFIFDRFYRADTSRTKNEYAGYGLGLSIAKKIVNIHNGNIICESKFGKGTKFTVSFNVA